jgi:hypothetical protein
VGHRSRAHRIRCLYLDSDRDDRRAADVRDVPGDLDRELPGGARPADRGRRDRGSRALATGLQSAAGRPDLGCPGPSQGIHRSALPPIRRDSRDRCLARALEPPERGRRQARRMARGAGGRRLHSARRLPLSDPPACHFRDYGGIPDPQGLRDLHRVHGDVLPRTRAGPAPQLATPARCLVPHPRGAVQGPTRGTPPVGRVGPGGRPHLRRRVRSLPGRNGRAGAAHLDGSHPTGNRLAGGQRARFGTSSWAGSWWRS